LETLDLKAAKRERKGNNPCRAMRRENKVPAVVYGPAMEAALPISVDRKELADLLKVAAGRQIIINLAIEDNGEKSRKVMIKELQQNTLTSALLHADFYEVDMTREIIVEIAVETVGTPVGVQEGGVLNLVRRELAVKCLPGNVPSAVTVDVSGLNIGDSIHLLDLALPDGVEIPDASINFTVLAVSGPEKEKVEPEEGEEGEGEAASADEES
jgi:large subunit ribosomal protein L25